MLVTKTFNLRGVMMFAGRHLIWLSAWMLLIASLYHFTNWRWLAIPWLPLSVVGTAVAFYVGFKNNQAYDRLWEGRKIWGAIINSSRSWGSMVKAYVNNKERNELYEMKKELVHRHIAWVYTLRKQLLVSTQWEHVNLRKHIGSMNRERMELYGVGLYKDEDCDAIIKKYLPLEDSQYIATVANAATHLIDIQSQQLASLHDDDCLNNFRHVELQKILNEFYDHQGRAERIKKFPLPRQYGSLSFIFVCIFIFLLPFGIVGEFSKLGGWGVWLSVPFGVLVGWVYVVMELIGDYSENPFEGLFNDVPMLSICRTIEIDLLQMMGETQVPKPISDRNGVLM